MKVRRVEQELVGDGWQLVRQQGSHRHYAKPGHASIITVSGKPRDEMTPGQLSSIRRTTGLRLR